MPTESLAVAWDGHVMRLEIVGGAGPDSRIARLELGATGEYELDILVRGCAPTALGW